MTDPEMQNMLIEYMGKGFLENIIAMVRQEPELARFIPPMISRENLGVRLGATALVEELAKEDQAILKAAVPGLIALLRDGNPTVRGDAASLLGMTGGETARGELTALLRDGNEAVRLMAKMALEDLSRGG